MSDPLPRPEEVQELLREIKLWQDQNDPDYPPNLAPFTNAKSLLYRASLLLEKFIA